jgi:hypothetical protein
VTAPSSNQASCLLLPALLVLVLKTVEALQAGTQERQGHSTVQEEAMQ